MRFELRVAFRALRASPAVSLLAVICMGLGVGAVTTIYSTASAFTLHPLPQMERPERLMVLTEAPASAPLNGAAVSRGTFNDLRTLPEFSMVAAVAPFTANIAGYDLPERADAGRVTADFFRLAGQTALLGRTFLPHEMLPGADRVVVLSHGLWQRRFGADPTVAGRTVRLNGEPWVIVGVMSRDFVFPSNVQLWVPLAPTPAERDDRDARELFTLARLAPGVSFERAITAIAVLGARLAEDWPAAYEARVINARPAESFFGDGPRPFMSVMLGAVACLLLIACANVANLLLARATGRRRETGVRVALGATRGRIARQFLMESLLVSLAGGAVGIVLAMWGTRATANTVPLEVQQYIPGFGAIHLDARAIVVALLSSMVAALIAGLAPALAGSSVDVVTALKDSGQNESPGSASRRLRAGLVVGEIALALMLVYGAALMVATFQRLSISYPGFRTDHVLTGAVSLPGADYPTDSSVVQFWERLQRELAATPGVERAELATVLPMTWREERERFFVDGEAPEKPLAVPSMGFRRVSPGYLEGSDVRLVGGRALEAADAQDHMTVAVLSVSAAARLFPNGDAIGRRVVTGDRSMEVVGVVQDVRANPLSALRPADVVYVPLAQWSSRSAYLVLRTVNDPAALIPAVQAAVGRVDARLAAGEMSTMQRVVETVTSPQAATASMMLAAAIIALVLAAVGTYGVMSYAVARRTREIGLRMALGAERRQVIGMVVGAAGKLAAAGIAIGALGALGLGQAMRAILFDTSPADLPVLTGAALALAVVALVAGYVPARRAARVDPMTAIRTE